MEEINLKSLFKFFIKKIKLVILMCFISIILGLVYIALNNQVYYKTETSLMILTNSNGSSNQNYKSYTVNENLINTYSYIVKSNTILNKVINDLKLDINSKALLNKIKVNAIVDSGIIEIIVTDTDNKRVLDIANKLVYHFSLEIDELIKENNSKVIVIDEATEVVKFNKISAKNTVLLSIILGCGIGLVYVFLAYCFNNNIKSENDIKKLGLKIIGNIDKFSKEELFIIRNNIKYSFSESKVILVASIDKDSKRIISNLVSVFEENEKVLLVENKKELENIVRKITTLKDKYDRIIICCNLNDNLSKIIELSTVSDVVLAVCKYEVSKFKDLEKLLNSLKIINVDLSGIIINE